MSWVLVLAACAVTSLIVLLTVRAILKIGEKYRIAQEHLDNFLKLANDAIFSRTLDGEITAWNRAAEHFYGLKAEQVLGTHFFPAFATEHDSSLDTFLSTVARGEVIRDFYTKYTSATGAVIATALTGIPVRDRTGNISGMHIIARDADALTRSEQVQISAALTSRLRAIVDHSVDPVALVNAQAKAVYCSAATQRLLGCFPCETWGCDIFEYLHDEDQENVRGVFQQALGKPGKPIKVRARIRSESSSWLWVEVVLMNLLDTAAVNAVLINFRDITEALAAEDAACKSNERFARAFQCNPLALSISTRDEGRYIDVNDAYLEMLELAREEVIGQTSSQLNIWVDPEDRSTLIDEVIATRGRRKPVQRRMRARNGEIHDVHIYAELIEMDGLPCVLAITQDVTIAKRMEHQFLRAQRMEAVGRLAGGLAHDFNNVLGVIIGHSELAQEQLSADHPINRNISQIKKAADRATSLIRQLLAFSRQLLLYPRVLDLNATILNLNEMLVPMLGEDISIEFHPAVSLSAVRADPGQIEQVIMNLVLNARDAMPTGGKLIIETADVELDSNYVAVHAPVVAGKYVMMSVTDTGSGIREENIPHIFEPFFTTKGPGKGTGLGLSTVYGIVKQSNGYIWVYSEVDKGTTFKIYFPRVAESPGDVPKTKHQTPLLTTQVSETILVVEDDELLRGLVVRLLSARGYKVLEAEGGQAALDLVNRTSERIDLLLTDVIMPTLSGGELANLLRAKLPNLKVLFMSGYSSELVTRHGALHPEMLVIEKPFTRSALLAQVRAALHSSPPANESSHDSTT